MPVCTYIHAHVCLLPCARGVGSTPCWHSRGPGSDSEAESLLHPEEKGWWENSAPRFLQDGEPCPGGCCPRCADNQAPGRWGGPRLGQPPARRPPFPRSLLEAPCDGPWGRQRGRPEAPLAPQAVICRPPPASSPSRIRNPPPPPGHRGLGPEAGAPAALSLRSAGVPPGWEGGVAWALDEAHQADPSLPPQATLSHNSGRKAWWFLPETLESKGPCRCQGHHHRDL